MGTANKDGYTDCLTAILPSSSKSLKRGYEADASGSDNDNENIDPAIFLSPSKKSKGYDGLAKPQQYHLKSSLSTSSFKTRTIATPKRLQLSTTKTTPISAPVGGRSPTRKRAGILSRRRVTAAPFTRVDPPSFGRANSNGMPFSLDAALAGTVPEYTPKQAPVPDQKDDMPGKWFFPIHEDTPEEELGNLVQHGYQTLDISDDESKSSGKDARGKENVPPADYSGIVPVQRKDMMSDEVRTPLGDLNAADYYAAGCDISSFVMVPEEHDIDFAFAAPGKEFIGGQMLLKEVLSKNSTSAPSMELKESSVETAESVGRIVIQEDEYLKTAIPSEPSLA